MKAEGRVFRAWEAILQMRAMLHPTWARPHGWVAPLWWARQHLPSNWTHTIEGKELKSVNEQSLRKWVTDRWDWERRAADVAAWQSLCRQAPQRAARRCTSIIAFLDTSARGDRRVNRPAKCVFLPFPGNLLEALVYSCHRTAGAITAPRSLSWMISEKLKLATLVERPWLMRRTKHTCLLTPRAHTASCSRDNTATSARNCREIKAAASICAGFYLWIHLPARRWLWSSSGRPTRTPRSPAHSLHPCQQSHHLLMYPHADIQT